MFAAYRLARTSPRQAADHWARMESRFNAEERGFVWGQIGHQGALRHDPQTLAWYAKAGDMSDLQLEWKGRAALRAGNWQEVISAVDAMVHRKTIRRAATGKRAR
jgi:soluble lytic murein transglycosylase